MTINLYVLRYDYTVTNAILNIMPIIEAIVLGLVQGLTEFIPVSSSGHLLLLQEWFGNDNSIVFDVAVHVGTLAALVVYFYKDIVLLLRNIHKPNKHGKLARILAMATVPGVVAGLLFADYIDNTLRSSAVAAWALIVVALFMIAADKFAKQSTSDVTKRNGLLIGVAQVLALVPGVSRSGITMATGLFLGLTRQAAARFSFLLAMPIVAGSAVGLLLTDTADSEAGVLPIMIGIVTAFLSGLFAIKFMLTIIGRLGLTPFALYRIALGVIVLLVLV